MRTVCRIIALVLVPCLLQETLCSAQWSVINVQRSAHRSPITDHFFTSQALAEPPITIAEPLIRRPSREYIRDFRRARLEAMKSGAEMPTLNREVNYPAQAKLQSRGWHPRLAWFVGHIATTFLHEGVVIKFLPVALFAYFTGSNPTTAYGPLAVILFLWHFAYLVDAPGRRSHKWWYAYGGERALVTILTFVTLVVMHRRFPTHGYINYLVLCMAVSLPQVLVNGLRNIVINAGQYAGQLFQTERRKWGGQDGNYLWLTFRVYYKRYVMKYPRPTIPDPEIKHPSVPRAVQKFFKKVLEVVGDLVMDYLHIPRTVIAMRGGESVVEFGKSAFQRVSLRWSRRQVGESRSRMVVESTVKLLKEDRSLNLLQKFKLVLKLDRRRGNLLAMAITGNLKIGDQQALDIMPPYEKATRSEGQRVGAREVLHHSLVAYAAEHRTQQPEDVKVLKYQMDHLEDQDQYVFRQICLGLAVYFGRLGEIARGAIRTPLVSMFRDDPRPLVRATIARAFTDAMMDPRNLDEALQALESPDSGNWVRISQVRMIAAALKRYPLDDPPFTDTKRDDVARALLRRLHDETADNNLRIVCFDALVILGWAPTEVENVIQTASNEFLMNPDSMVQEKALETLVRFGTDPAVRRMDVVARWMIAHASGHHAGRTNVHLRNLIIAYAWRLIPYTNHRFLFERVLLKLEPSHILKAENPIIFLKVDALINAIHTLGPDAHSGPVLRRLAAHLNKDYEFTCALIDGYRESRSEAIFNDPENPYMRLHRGPLHALIEPLRRNEHVRAAARDALRQESAPLLERNLEPIADKPVVLVGRARDDADVQASSDKLIPSLEIGEFLRGVEVDEKALADMIKAIAERFKPVPVPPGRILPRLDA